MIFLAGLQGIPEEYYDAAKIDGANWAQRLRRVYYSFDDADDIFEYSH